MELRYDIDSSSAHVQITGAGRLSMPAMIAMVDEVAMDPRFRSHFAVIFDIRAADYTAELNDGDAFVAALKRRDQDFQSRFALTVPESLHVLAKLFCLLAQVSGIDRIQCFTDIEEARKWCGLAKQPPSC